MGNCVINFKEKTKEKLIEKIISTMEKMYGDTKDIANSYYNLMLENPSLAIKELPNFINKARDITPDRSFVEGIAGGPNHDWTGPMLNIVGIMYPTLKKDIRKKGLLQCLNFLDQLNYFNSQDNVELINEPWLVADIVINSPLYWCGFKQYCNLLEQNPKWIDFSKHIESVKSDFWLALTVTIPKYSSLEIRTKFYRQFPDLIDRTKDAIAAITFNYAQHANKKEGISIKDYIQKSFLKYDPLLQGDIRAKMKEEKWIKLDN